MAMKLIYKDVAIGADEDAEVTAEMTVEKFSDITQIPFGTNTGAVATCERNAWGLTPTYKVRGAQSFALWSTEKSNAEGTFTNTPIMYLDFTEQYTATGLTFRFSPDAGEYCSRIGVVWYQGDTAKASGIFYPTSPLYALENTVEAFDKIGIVFFDTNLPERRLKLEQIIVGIIREFDGRELTSAQSIHEINLISDTVPINVLDASFHSSGEAEFLFQKKQPVEAYNGADLIGVYYIENGERSSANNYSISCQDAIGTLELDEYKGGLWLTDTPVETILANVVGDTFVIDIDEALKGTKLRGYIKEGTKREALQQIAFALGACIDTSGTSHIKLFKADLGEGAEIPATETYKGGKVNTSDTVTEVEVIAYDIVDERPDERPSQDEGEIEYNGEKYKYTMQAMTAHNPNATVNTLPNKITFDACFLCNTNNAQARANDILAYYMRKNTYTARHIVSGQNVGDRATVHLPWNTTASGNITKMSISVTNITVSETEFLLD